MTAISVPYGQASLVLSQEAGKLVAAETADPKARSRDVNDMQASLLSSSPQWPSDSYRQGCPYPIVVNQSQLHDVEILHTLLTSALTNIVERWWSDRERRFPERMPLERYEEDVLRVCAIPMHSYLRANGDLVDG